MTIVSGFGQGVRRLPLRQKHYSWRRLLPLAPAVLFLLVIFFYPVFQILFLSFQSNDETLTTEHYAKLFSSSIYVRVLFITFKISLLTTLVALIGGYPLAYLLATTTDRVRSLMIVGVLMPFWTSFLVKTFAWMVLLGHRGAINELLMKSGLIAEPFRLMFNLTGVLVGLSHALMPLAVLTMYSVMQNIDSNLLKAAATLGGRGGQAFWRIYFPLSFPGVAAAGLLVFITTMGWFVTPMLLGGDQEVMISQLIIFHIESVLNWGFAGALAVFLLASTIVVFVLYDRLIGMSTLQGSTAAAAGSKFGRGAVSRAGSWAGTLVLAGLGRACATVGEFYDRVVPPRRRAARHAPFSRISLWAAAIGVLAFLLLPTFFVIPVSFTESSFLSWPPRGFTLKWYETVAEAQVWRSAAIRSVVVGVASASLAMLIAVPAGFVMARERLPAKVAILGFMLSPMILPHIIVAVALYYFYAQLGLIGTSLGLILAHAAFSIPLIVVIIIAALKNYDIRLDHAAWTLGAKRLTTMRRVTFPIIRAAMLAAFLFAFIKSFDELAVAMFVSGAKSATLPKQMWVDAVAQVSPVLTAVSTIFLGFVTVAILVAEYFNRRARY